MLFTFARFDTGQVVTVSSRGRKHARSKAAIKLGLKSDQLNEIRFGRGRKRPRNGKKAWKPGRSGLGFNVPGNRVFWL